MVHSFTKRRRSLPPAIVGVLAAGLMVVGQIRAPGQDASSPAASGGEALKQSFVTPGATKPVQIYADDITTWVEGPQRVFLLKGRVWIEQGVLNLRMPQGVV